MTRIVRGVEPGLGPSAVAVGVFDGVHTGHQALLGSMVDAARELGVKAAVLTFDPHPACVVAPDRAPRLLYSVGERCRLLAEAGVDEILVLPFTVAVAQMSAEDFVTRLLCGALRARAVIVGENFRFGHKQAGDVRLLREMGPRCGFETRALGAVATRGIMVSSSEVRKRIEGGEVSLACRLLGRPYALAGDVVTGHGVGTKQTVPTLNLATAAEVLPARGVYITRTHDGARRWNSITNIGVRPTFGGDDGVSIETYLLEPLEGPTPGAIRVEFLRRVREERRFESPEALRAQIFRDVGVASKYFRRVSGA